MTKDTRRSRKTAPTLEGMEQRLSLSGSGTSVGATVGTTAIAVSHQILLTPDIPPPLLPTPPDSVGP